MSTRTTIDNIHANWRAAATPQMVCLLLVQRVSRLLLENAQEALIPFDLSFTEFEVLAALRASPPPHRLLPTELYEAMLISSGGLTKVLRVLEERKLISRPRDSKDRRQHPVAITAKGMKIAEKGLSCIAGADESALSSAQLTDADYRRMTSQLSRLAAALESDQ